MLGIPIEATAREPINRPDTYQRLPKRAELTFDQQPVHAFGSEAASWASGSYLPTRADIGVAPPLGQPSDLWSMFTRKDGRCFAALFSQRFTGETDRTQQPQRHAAAQAYPLSQPVKPALKSL